MLYLPNSILRELPVGHDGDMLYAEDPPMPRPKSDLKPRAVNLSDSQWEFLRSRAEKSGLVVQAGASAGQPDRSAALRAMIDQAAERARKKIAKAGG